MKTELNELLRAFVMEPGTMEIQLDKRTFDEYVDFNYKTATTQMAKDLAISASVTGLIAGNNFSIRRGAEIKDSKIIPITEGRKLTFKDAKKKQEEP